jgi:hypothetical protein
MEELSVIHPESKQGLARMGMDQTIKLFAGKSLQHPEAA